MIYESLYFPSNPINSIFFLKILDNSFKLYKCPIPPTFWILPNNEFLLVSIVIPSIKLPELIIILSIVSLS